MAKYLNANYWKNAYLLEFRQNTAVKAAFTFSVPPEQEEFVFPQRKNETKTFQFDYVYPMETTQREIYDQVAFPIVDSIFQGYNGTVFAYGQTGCGKTFTMMGIVDNPELKGIIPNAFNHIFGFIKTEGD